MPSCYNETANLNFKSYVDCVQCQASEMLGIIHYRPLHTMAVVYTILHIGLIRSKLEYGSVAWNNLTLTDSNMLEKVHRKFANLSGCISMFSV
jgi:hypothetical protein